MKNSMKFTGGFNENMMDIQRALQSAGWIEEEFDEPTKEELDEIVRQQHNLEDWA